MKVIKYILFVLFWTPLLAVLLFFTFMLITSGVNHYASFKQLNTLKKTIISVAPNTEILDTYSETGNTLSVVLFKTDVDLPELENKLYEHYPRDEWSFWVDETASIQSWYVESGSPSYFETLDVPEETQGTYIVYLNQPAPFVDNFEGH